MSSRILRKVVLDSGPTTTAAAPARYDNVRRPWPNSIAYGLWAPSALSAVLWSRARAMAASAAHTYHPNPYFTSHHTPPPRNVMPRVLMGYVWDCSILKTKRAVHDSFLTFQRQIGAGIHEDTKVYDAGHVFCNLEISLFYFWRWFSSSSSLACLRAARRF